MKRKYVLLALILFIFFIIVLGVNNKTYAADLDEIVNYVITVEPRMNDASLDITYEISWKVLDSTTEGPLEWVRIGTPNENFDTPTALTKNISSITKYSGSNLRIVFDKAYYAGEIITFKYSIHQPYMCTVSWGKCNYEFTPAWFTDAKVDNITIKWNSDQVKSSNTKKSDGSYLLWKKSNMEKGEKLTANVKYDKKAFSAITSTKKSSSSNGSVAMFYAIMFIIMIALSIISSFSRMGGGGYYRHRGFYGGGFYRRRLCT